MAVHFESADELAAWAAKNRVRLVRLSSTDPGRVIEVRFFAAPSPPQPDESAPLAFLSALPTTPESDPPTARDRDMPAYENALNRLAGVKG